MPKAEPRVANIPADWESRLPAETWEGRDYTSIHATILFADLQNSVLLSSTLSPHDYDQLVDAFQQAMKQLIEELKADSQAEYPIGEFNVVGDQLSIFFFEPEEVYRNWLLDSTDELEGEARTRFIRECRERNENIVYRALQAAIRLKNLWLVQQFNLERVIDNRSPFDLGVGMHTGRVYLRNRADGTRRIEGYTVNYAKRIEGFSRQGRYSQIMISNQACDIIRGSVRAHTQLRQRIFFHRHEVPLELLKGITRAQQVYELKFFHRIGIHIGDDALEQYDSLFAIDHRNIWAYYQLVDHFAYEKKDWETAYRLAKQAYLAHPEDEKVLLDLAKYHLGHENLDLAEEYCRQVITHNPDFDLAFEVLAQIALVRDDETAQLEATRLMLLLSPGSAANHLNYGLTLCETGRLLQGVFHVEEAFRIYDKFPLSAFAQKALRDLEKKDKLPEQLKQYLAD